MAASPVVANANRGCVRVTSLAYSVALLVAAMAVLGSGPASAASDRAALNASLMTVLEEKRTGSTHAWHNPATGTSGTITILDTRVRSDDVPCRDYRATVRRINGPEQTLEGTGCRSTAFRWTLDKRRGEAPDADAVISSTDVREAQRRLAALGYDPGAIDGLYGAGTRRAVEAYQRDRGLTVDGRVTRRLLDALASDSAHGAPRVRHAPPAAETAWRAMAETVAATPNRAPLGAAEAYRRVNKSVWVVVGLDRRSFRRGGDYSLGSAVAVDDRHLLTNCHIIAGKPAVRLVQDEDVREAHVVSADPAGDRCVLEVAEGRLTPVPGVRAFRDLDVGERVFTVGTPGGLERTLGEGIVSGLRSRGGRNFVQTTAPISKGSSGGGLFDAYGNLIGITTAYVGDSQLLNFAIAADEFWR